MVLLANYTSKDTIQKVKGQSTNWKKIFAYHVFEKRTYIETV